jgi:hypothetical protein
MPTTLSYKPQVRSLVMLGLPSSARPGASVAAPMAVEPERWDVTLAAYGSAGMVSVTLALRGGDHPMSVGPGVASADQLVRNLLTATQTTLVTIDVYVGRPNSPTRWNSADLTQVFSGYLDLVDWEFDTDTVTITGRDASSLLMDSRTLSNFGNLTPDQIATQFAKDVGLTPLVTHVKTLAGSFYQQDTIHMGYVPRQKWDILLYLARSVGFDVFVTPQRQLYFGPPPQPTTPPLVFSWLDPAAPFGTALMRCKITHSPRRNRTFKVLVKSYHPKTTQIITGTSIVLGIPIPTETTKTLPAGTYRGQGPAGSLVFNELTAALEGKPVYQFHVAGLTPDQAQKRAEAIAQNIARHELIADIAVEGNAAITPQTVLSFRGLGHGFDTQAFYPQRVRHIFQVPQGRGGQNEGWITEVTALNLPPSAVDDPSLAITAS